MRMRWRSFVPDSFCLLAMLCVLLAGCGHDGTPEADSVPLRSTLAAEAAPPRYSEHLSCTLQSDRIRWQHLYRLSFDDLVAEFVGGQGGAIKTLQSTNMQVSPDLVAISFEIAPQADRDVSNIESFRVRIQRRTLAYQLFWTLGEQGFEANEPHLSGQCVLLDVEYF